MSLLGKLAALFGGGSASKVCVVDGDRFAGGERVGPGERFQALNKLARYAGREELKIKVVFGGRPLREAGDGDVYNDVEVFYGETADDVRARLTKLVRASSSAVLVTSDQALESDLRARGCATMRLSTLRKAMETSSGEGGGGGGGGREGREGGGERSGGGGRDRDGGRRGRGRGGRGRGERRPRPDQEGEGGGGQPAAEGNAPRAESGSGATGGANSSVKNLIDLVE